MHLHVRHRHLLWVLPIRERPSLLHQTQQLSRKDLREHQPLLALLAHQVSRQLNPVLRLQVRLVKRRRRLLWLLPNQEAPGRQHEHHLQDQLMDHLRHQKREHLLHPQQYLRRLRVWVQLTSDSHGLQQHHLRVLLTHLL
jgi:hypothetical protein